MFDEWTPRLSLIAAATLAAIILAPRSGRVADGDASPADAGFVSIYGDTAPSRQAALSSDFGAAGS